MKIIFAITLLIVVNLSGIAYAEISELTQLFPTSKNLSSNWEISKFAVEENVELVMSGKTPEGVAQRFALESSNSDSEMLVEMHIMGFENEFDANQVHTKYLEFLKENFDEIKIQDKTTSRCKAFSANEETDNESSAIVCTNDRFMIISTAQQRGGKVIENGMELVTPKVAIAFMQFSLSKIDQQNSIIIPEWIKNNAKWWAQGQVEDNEFILSIEFLISKNIIKINQENQPTGSNNVIPDWVRTNALWWTEDKISDRDFVRGLEHLIQIGIIKIN